MTELHNALAGHPLLVDIFWGVATWRIFKRFEPETPLPLFLLLVVAPGVLSVLHLRNDDISGSVLPSVLQTYSTIHVSLAVSILAYRASPFHPLANYPGPFLHKLSKFRMAYILYSRKKHLGVDIAYYQSLHRKYGSYVRIGPNEVSVCDVEAIGPVLGAKGFPKGPFWDGRVAPGVTRSLISERDPTEHARRRKPWNRAFSQTSLQAYEEIVRGRTVQFVQALEKFALEGTEIDLDQWISFYTFDFMGDMAFGGGFELMKHGEDHTGVIELMDSAFERNNMTAHVPYTLRYIVKLPTGKHNNKFLAFASERVAIRKKEGAVRKDLFYHLIDEEGLESHPPPMNELMSDGLLAIVAGSDTTSHVVVNIFYFLMQNPEAYARLRKEVDSVFPESANVYDTSKHREMPYLEAVINEAMRLQPPVPNGAQRSTQKIGARMIGERFVPAGTQVQINTYAVQRDPRYFSPHPESFWPERWLDETAATTKGYVHDVRAFFPFSFGPAMCVGRPLAYIQMRMALCALVRRFEMRLTCDMASEEGAKVRGAYEKAGRGVLPIYLMVRKGGEESAVG